MKAITSPHNERYKSIVKLTTKKGRDEQNAFLLDGFLLLAEARNCDAEIRQVIYRDSSAETAAFFMTGEGAEAENFARLQMRLRDDLFDKLTDQVTPGEIITVVTKPAPELWTLRGKNVVVLDRLQDPGNVGTIMRTAEAAGFAGVIAVKGTADNFSPKVCRAAAGAVLRLPMFYAGDAREALDMLKEAQIRPVRCAMDGASPYAGKALDGNIALIIGNEGAGISDEFKALVSDAVGIPMAEKSESLNAAVAAGILMYEKKRQED